MKKPISHCAADGFANARVIMAEQACTCTGVVVDVFVAVSIKNVAAVCATNVEQLL